MVNIITRDNLIEPEFILDNESFFNLHVPLRDVPNCRDIIQSIDEAKILDMDTGLVKTPFGLTDEYHLSTGCKTALNISYILNHPELGIKTVNITECGCNALNEIFAMEPGELKLLLKHQENSARWICNDAYVNGEYIDDIAYMEL